jgi:hypothetical protein
MQRVLVAPAKSTVFGQGCAVNFGPGSQHVHVAENLIPAKRMEFDSPIALDCRRVRSR